MQRALLNVSAASGFTLTIFPVKLIFARVLPALLEDFALSAQDLMKKKSQKYLEFDKRY